jgi:transcription elongation GreA/GreB family factor
MEGVRRGRSRGVNRAERVEMDERAICETDMKTIEGMIRRKMVRDSRSLKGVKKVKRGRMVNIVRFQGTCIGRER